MRCQSLHKALMEEDNTLVLPPQLTFMLNENSPDRPVCTASTIEKYLKGASESRLRGSQKPWK